MARAARGLAVIAGALVPHAIKTALNQACTPLRYFVVGVHRPMDRFHVLHVGDTENLYEQLDILPIAVPPVTHLHCEDVTC